MWTDRLGRLPRGRYELVWALGGAIVAERQSGGGKAAAGEIAAGYTTTGAAVELGPGVRADIKGDLSGLCRPGQPSDRITARATETADDWAPTPYPVEFLSLGD